MNEPKPIVLLVDDNEDDIFLFQRALRRENIECDLRIARDGQEALAYLSAVDSNDPLRRQPHPALVVLDLKLPLIHGLEVLESASSLPMWKNTRCVVLTSSPVERDRERAAELGARSYHVKPPTPLLMQHLCHLLQSCAAS